MELFDLRPLFRRGLVYVLLLILASTPGTRPFFPGGAVRAPIFPAPRHNPPYRAHGSPFRPIGGYPLTSKTDG